MTHTVQLHRASLPFPLRVIADHHWFTLFNPATGTWNRWEIWQSKNAGGTSWDHLHRDLKPLRENVGGGPTLLVHEWTGIEAQRLAEILTHPDAYPHRTRYRPWPGPNSNTYAAWVLQEAGIPHPLTRRAIGRNYR